MDLSSESTDREDSDMDTSEVAQSNASSSTTIISLTMVKTETTYPDGLTETVEIQLFLIPTTWILTILTCPRSLWRS